MKRDIIKDNFISEIVNKNDSDIIEVRKLTPSEALRLQGMREDDIKKLYDAGIGVTDLYQLAGNSIAISCLQALYKNIIKTEDDSSADNADMKPVDVCNEIVQTGHLIESKSGRVNQSPYRIYSVKGICPTLMASMGCGGRSPLIVKKNGKYI